MMPKRAAIIITDADGAIVTFIHTYAQGQAMSGGPVGLSEQLLADLRMLVDYADGKNMRSFTLSEVSSGAARVRALLPKEDDHE